MSVDTSSSHYKGKFSNIYEVNEKYPGGGIAGDYVDIAGWAHYWSADRGTWCVNEKRDEYWDELLTQINSDVSSVKELVTTETSERKAADTTLQGNIDAEASARKAADTTLQTNIDTVSTAVSTETSERKAADTTLQANIESLQSKDTELTEAIENEAKRRGEVDAEIDQRRADGDEAVYSALTTETSERKAADTTLQGNIDAEASARQSADDTLQGNIDTVSGNLSTEVTERKAADTTLQTNIDAEASARQSADDTLQGNIDTVSGNLSTETSERKAAIIDLRSSLDEIALTYGIIAFDGIVEGDVRITEQSSVVSEGDACTVVYSPSKAMFLLAKISTTVSLDGPSYCINWESNTETVKARLHYQTDAGVPYENKIYVDSSSNIPYRWTGSELLKLHSVSGGDGISVEALSNAEIDAAIG